MKARILRSPALHFALVGVVLFAVSLVARQNMEPLNEERTQLIIPNSQIDLGVAQFQQAAGRPPTAEERQRVVEFVVDQEVLYQHARHLRMNQEPVAERRLALIAEFVAENPHEPAEISQRAMEAWELGLGHGDLVVRRIMIDGARRLIRGAVLVREPNEETMEKYYQENPDQFKHPGQMRLSHVALLSRLRGTNAETDARELLLRFQSNPLEPEQAAALGDISIIPPSLPSLPARELERRFGHQFVRQLEGLPAGSWQGPVLSKYGAHLVFVHERTADYVAPYSEVRADIRARVRQELADQYLALRMKDIREDFDIVIGGETS